MAKPTLKTVIFGEGEPLDPNKLNDLSQNIKTVYEMAIKQYSSDGTYKTVIDSGYVDIKIEKGIGISDVIKSTTLSKPIVIASVDGPLANGVQATLSISNSATNPQIRVSLPTNITRTLRVNYILVEKQLSQ